MTDSQCTKVDVPRGLIDRLAATRARTRLLELALLGNSGMSLDDGTYRDAVIQQAQDVARDLDEIAADLAGRSAAHAAGGART